MLALTVLCQHHVGLLALRQSGPGSQQGRSPLGFANGTVRVLICHSGRSRGVSTPVLVWAEAASVSASAGRRGAGKPFFRQICETVPLFVSLEKTQLPGKQRDCKTPEFAPAPQGEQSYQPHFA